MGKATGQMQERTQELLDHYNELYNWDYNEMIVTGKLSISSKSP